jgi:hypothetical protein
VLSLNKKILTVFLLACLALGLLSPLIGVLRLVGATGQNWLSGWSYRRSITISPSSGAGTGYQIQINTAYAAFAPQNLVPFSSLVSTLPIPDSNSIMASLSASYWDGNYLNVWYGSETTANNATTDSIYYMNSTSPFTSWSTPVQVIHLSGNGVRNPTSFIEGNTIYLLAETYNTTTSTYQPLRLYKVSKTASFSNPSNYVFIDCPIRPGTSGSFDNKYVAHACIEKIGSTYWMMYEALATNSTATICYAQTNNITGTWTKDGPVRNSTGGVLYNPYGPTVYGNAPDSFLSNTTVMIEIGNGNGGWWNRYLIGNFTTNRWTESTTSINPNDGYSNHCNFDSVGYINGMYYFLEQSWTSTIYLRLYEQQGNNIALNQHCRTDFGDVRFTASDGSTLLSYWIQNETASGTAIFWVKDTDNLNSASSTIYIYYGNSGVTTTSNGYNTFLFFDDFPGTSINSTNWNTTNKGNMTVSNSNLIVGSTTGTRGYITATKEFGLNTSWAVRAVWSQSLVDDIWFCMVTNASSSNSNMGVSGDTPANHVYFQTEANGAYIATTDTVYSPTSYQVYSLIRQSGHVNFYESGTLIDSLTSDVPTTNLGAEFIQGDVSGRVLVDWVFARKLVSTEPSVSSFGSETSALSPTISPTSATMDLGQSLLFTSPVSGGTPPYTYQWYLNGTAKGTNSSWTFTPSSSASYLVYVNVTDSTTLKVKSNTATVTVNTALSVTISPTSITMDVGQSKNFTSTVSGGTPAYTYQWYLGGSAISGATSPYYVYTPSSSGSYSIYLNVTDSASTPKVAKSNTATVTVKAAFSVSISPTSVTLDVGQSRNFTSTVTGGTSPYSYQWYLDGSAVSGATGTFYTYRASAAGSHTVYVKVTDSASTPVTATSNTASVTVSGALSVTISPGTVTMDVGQSETFTSTVTGGSGLYTYQWYLNGTLVGTGSNYTFTPGSPGFHNIYLNVTDSLSMKAKSNTATVTANAALSVTVSPSTWTMDVGQSKLFTSSASGGTGSYFYQWYLKGVAVSGATGASWTFSPSSADSYTVYVVATDSATTPTNAQSNIANVTVYSQLAVTITPLTSTIYLSQSQAYNSSVSGGTSPYSYQWYLNGSAVSGMTSSTWTFTPTSTGTYLIYVKTTDGVGQVAQSPNANLTVKPKPSMGVTINPSSAVIDLSQSVSFTSSITGGVSPFTYQWYLNGSAVSGTNSSAWTFIPTSARYYQVYLNVTDSLNTKAKSSIAFVTVNSLPSVSISPSPVVMDAGQSQVFTPTVSGGTSPYTYQWYLNGTAVSGATKASWTFIPSSGSYTVYVKVTDNVGMQATSNTAIITVNPTLSVTVSPSSVVLDVGQSQTFTATVYGGTSTFSYQWYLDGSSVSGATSSSWTYIPTSSSLGSHSVYVKVTDSASTPVTAQSNTASVTVNAALSVSISPISVKMDVGQSQVFNSSVIGGTSPYSYQWYLNGAKVNGVMSSICIFTPSSPGMYSVYVNVTDNTGAYAVSSSSTVIVNWQPTVTISPTSATIYNGQSQPFTSNARNGTLPYTYQWYLNGTAQTGATFSSWTYTPSGTGTYKIYLIVTDSVGQAAQSSNATLVVEASFITVTVSPGTAVLGLGQSQTFTSSVSGGIPSYTYHWYSDGNAISGATSGAYTFMASSVGSHQLCLNVTDSLNLKASFTVAINVWSLPFSVVSNSTVSGLVFNSTSEVLSFTVSGPSGTQGYANVTIAKTLIANTTGLEVYLDGNTINYTLTSTSYYWLLHFTYHHSTHKIVIYMNALQPEATSETQYGSFAIIGVITIALLVAAIFITGAIVKKREKKI